MYSYTWDSETGGLLLNTSPLSFSKEPRPVYYRELDILGFDKYWNYEKSDAAPYLWAEANNYFYRGKQVAKTKGGSLYTAPELIILDEPEPHGGLLQFVDIAAMVKKNQDFVEKLAQETMKKIYNTYVEYRDKVDVFYVAFSGGKDSVVVLDLVQRALPHNKFRVLFGDTGMEFPDTYIVIDKTQENCSKNGIEFFKAKSELTVHDSWSKFGPPAVTIRWCCGVHKTSPQIRLLQLQTGNPGFTGMAFTGVRGDESLSRSGYDDVTYGRKHQGQYSCHPLLEWNSAELFMYIYQERLILNEAYKKGNSRAGCLVCPMSSGKHEYMKAQCYPKEVDELVTKIKATSGKVNFSEEELSQFIDAGHWKSRKTGRELNFGYDTHQIESTKGRTVITVFNLNERWKEWIKTVGQLIYVRDGYYTLNFMGKTYEIQLDVLTGNAVFSFPNCGVSKNDITFISLIRSVIIKSIYCVHCGVCQANCPSGCINMKNGLFISEKCMQCHQCHDIHDHCVRYNSIRNRIGDERKMKSMDRYFSFGIRKEWLDIYFKYKGSEKFWASDGDTLVANKKKDAFLNFIKDAGLVIYNKTLNGDKYTRNQPNKLAQMLFQHGTNCDYVWAIILCNLVYTPQFNWFIKNIGLNKIYRQDEIKYMLEDIMLNDSKGLGRRNVADALKMILVKTPLGASIGLGLCDVEKKINATGTETIVLNSFHRESWQNPHPIVILYSLYKFAEACGSYYQFTLSRLLDHEIDSDGVSPTEIFGIGREPMEKILNGLSINHPEFINVSFTLDLESITLNEQKTSSDVLGLF